MSCIPAYVCNGNSRNVSSSKPSLHCHKRPWEGALYKWLTRSASDAMHKALCKWSTFIYIYILILILILIININLHTAQVRQRTCTWFQGFLAKEFVHNFNQRQPSLGIFIKKRISKCRNMKMERMDESYLPRKFNCLSKVNYFIVAIIIFL